jgi:hypothetical protein
MDGFLSNWGPKIFDADAVTKLFIENAIAKALDQSRWKGHTRLIRVRHMLLAAWKGLGITNVLHTNDVLNQAIDYFHETATTDSFSDSPAAANSNIKTTQRVSNDVFEKISAVELLFGIVKDTAIDAWKTEDRAILGKCLEYTVYFKENILSSKIELTVAIFKSKTLFWLNNDGHFSGWDVIMRVVLPLLAEKRTELQDPFIAELVQMSRDAGKDQMQSPAKYALESQTLLRPYIPKLEQMMTSDPKAKNLLNNIRNVLDYGVCIDNDELMDSTLNRVLQNLRFKVGGKGLFISASNTLFSHKNILAMSTATVAEYACANSRIVPGPVKWVGYAMYPHLFLMTRRALVGVENLFTRKTQADVAKAE